MVEIAISCVNVSTQGQAAYYISIALVASSVNTAAGGRDQAAALYVKTKVTDTVSNRVLAVIIAKL